MRREAENGDAQELSPALKLLLWLLLIATAALAIWQTTPPRALDESAAPDQFSAARAKMHLVEIAREAHPIGTAANHRVRDYLMEQLASLGAEVQLERTVGITNSGRQIYAGTAENIVATIRGTASRRAVMLATHYDSVPQGPGAADAGSGVAAILEVIRAVNAGAPLKNDIVILYTDGEEEGLIGAAGFVRDHPDIAQRVGVVLNLEARGSSGPALMFETSDRNGWLTREFARAAPYPFASSLAYEVYKQMPNDTDMTVFKKAGLFGLNFAFTGTSENYHTARDTPENLDARSLQQLGSNALALTRHFGNLDLQVIRQPDRVYFNPFGSSLVHYPPRVVWIILAADIALLGTLLLIGRARQTLTTLRVLAGALAFVPGAIAALAGAHLVWWVVRMWNADRLLVGDTWSNLLIALACLAAALAFAVAAQSWLASKLRGHNFAAGQLLALALFTAGVTCVAPEASYVLQWPLLFALAGAIAAQLVRNSTLLVMIATVPVILIFAPLGYQLLVVLGLDTISVTVLAALLALLLAATGGVMLRIGRPLILSVPLLLACSIGLVLGGLKLSHFSAEHPLRNSVFYSVSTDAGKAAWVSDDARPDEWTSQFLTRTPARGPAPMFTFGSSRAVLSAAADVIPVEPPTATVLSDTTTGDQRSLRLHLASPRRANVLLMRLPRDVALRAVAVGRSVDVKEGDGAKTPWLLRYNAPPAEGVELRLELAAGAPFTCWLADRSYGMPQIEGSSYTPRPADMIPTYGSDVVVVAREYTF